MSAAAHDFLGFDDIEEEGTSPAPAPTPTPQAPAPTPTAVPAAVPGGDPMAVMMQTMAQMQMQMMQMMQAQMAAQTAALERIVEAVQQPAAPTPASVQAPAPTPISSKPAKPAKPPTSQQKVEKDDPYVERLTRCAFLRVEATVVSLNGHGVTLRLPDGRGVRVSRKEWRTLGDPGTETHTPFSALEWGQTRDYFIPSHMKIETPVRMTCAVQRVEAKYTRVLWRGAYGSLFLDGILNRVEIEGRENLRQGETMILEVLPWYVRNAKSKGKAGVPVWIQAVEEGVESEAGDASSDPLVADLVDGDASKGDGPETPDFDALMEDLS